MKNHKFIKILLATSIALQPCATLTNSSWFDFDWLSFDGIKKTFSIDGIKKTGIYKSGATLCGKFATKCDELKVGAKNHYKKHKVETIIGGTVLGLCTLWLSLKFFPKTTIFGLLGLGVLCFYKFAKENEAEPSANTDANQNTNTNQNNTDANANANTGTNPIVNTGANTNQTGVNTNKQNSRRQNKKPGNLRANTANSGKKPVVPQLGKLDSKTAPAPVKKPVEKRVEGPKPAVSVKDRAKIFEGKTPQKPGVVSPKEFQELKKKHQQEAKDNDIVLYIKVYAK